MCFFFPFTCLIIYYLLFIYYVLPHRFFINFKTGQSEKDDVAFHFNPRHNANVVMNSFRNGQWEAEEFASVNPFKVGEAFEMFIVIKSEGYQVCAL